MSDPRRGEAILELVAVMDQLRAQCPWTSVQTHESLRSYVIEEAYEVADAIGNLADGQDDLIEELGDLLMQVVIHAAVAQTTTGWDIDDVARAITAKLIERSPHVFGDEVARTPEEVDAAWQRIKATHKQRTSALDGIPHDLPALMYASAVLRRTGQPAPADGDDIGAELLRLVEHAAAEGVDPEQALRHAARRLAG